MIYKQLSEEEMKAYLNEYFILLTKIIDEIINLNDFIESELNKISELQ